MSTDEIFRITSKNQAHDDTMFLNTIDQKLGFYLRDLFFYRDLDVERLRSALAEVLDSYHFWTGRLRFNDSNQMEIVCNNAGVFFALAKSSLSMDEVTSDNWDELFFLEEGMTTSLEELPLLTIQVTSLLGDSSYAIAMLVHHTLGDATAIMTFLLNFASVARGDGLYMAPNGDRTWMRARDPPRVAFEHEEFVKQTDGDNCRFTLTKESVLKSVSRRKMAPNKPRKVLAFSSERLRELKQAALEDGTLGSCSTFEALAAFIWRAHAASLPGKSSNEILRLMFVVDTKNILDPPLGDNFCGNCYYGAVTELKLAELQELPLSSIVARIQEAKKRITNEYVRSGWDFLKLTPDAWYDHDRETVINSWPRLMRKAAELDFGTGKPLRVEFPLDPRNPSIFFFPLISDGILVSVNLDPIPLATFEKLAMGENQGP